MPDTALNTERPPARPAPGAGEPGSTAPAPPGVGAAARPCHAPADHPAPPAEKRVLLLGSTGSIGTQTLRVIEHLNDLHERGESPTRYRVVGLAAGKNGGLLAEQAADFGVPDVALADEISGVATFVKGTRVRRGAASAERLVRDVGADVVLAAMVGSAGLPATLAAVELGRDVALANKETLVAAGALVVPAAVRSGARLLPVDSEHAAIWQCLQGERAGAICPPCALPATVSRVVLTASGGPFRTRTKEETYHATRAAALDHPTWSMGPKVTIDSASLTNKALEVIEAHWLFGVPASRIGVLIHPQSVVHSLVEFTDGSAIAHLGPADMRSPIQYALTFPHRPAAPMPPMDLAKIGTLEFAEPDHDRFPALRLAYRVIGEGGTAGAIFNAANEAAVEAFLAGTIPFGRITELASAALDGVGAGPLGSLADAVRADAEARAFVAARVG